MEIIIYKNQPYEDIVRPISASELKDQEFVYVQKSVDSVFLGIGAAVIVGVPYGGELPAVKLFIHAEQSEAVANFNNRPA